LRRFLFPLIFGLAGAGILIWLGTWQVQQLSWKQEVLADINTRIVAAPVAVPQNPDPAQAQYLPVEAIGDLVGISIRVLVSQKNIGAGYRMISAFEIEGRTVLVDRGFVRVGQEADVGPAQNVAIVGNLHWPDEIDSYTPAPDLVKNLWFARDVDAMAAHLGTEALLVVARQSDEVDTNVTPLPVSITGIPNDHLSYAITWYSLAVVWLAMSGALIWRNRQS
jgi:surfeit locus 1 family protein